MKTLGPYELADELGRGGMGAVYRARHVPTGAWRALKVLDGVPDPESLERFRREGEALARLAGAGVVRVHHSGLEGRRFYLAMDLVAGGSLRARLRARGRLEPREACRVARSLARTLAACHAAGLVHRDVKPDNVLLDEGDAPLLADFGCVRDLGRSALSETGQTLGTLDYMSPEQLAGERAGPPADVWALGALLHECVTGSPPFEGGLLERVASARRGARRGRAELARDVPALDALLARALAPEPADRPDAAALARELEAVVAEPGAAGSTPRRVRASPPVLVALAVLALAVITALVLAADRRAPAPPPVAPTSTSPPARSPGPLPDDREAQRARKVREDASAVVAALLAETARLHDRPDAIPDTGLAARTTELLPRLAALDPGEADRQLRRLGEAEWRAILERTFAYGAEETSDRIIALVEAASPASLVGRDALLGAAARYRRSLDAAEPRPADPEPLVRALAADAALTAPIDSDVAAALFVRGTECELARPGARSQDLLDGLRTLGARALAELRSRRGTDREGPTVPRLRAAVARRSSALAAENLPGATERVPALREAILLREEALADSTLDTDVARHDAIEAARLRCLAAHVLGPGSEEARVLLAGLDDYRPLLATRSTVFEAERDRFEGRVPEALRKLDALLVPDAPLPPDTREDGSVLRLLVRCEGPDPADRETARRAVIQLLAGEDPRRTFLFGSSVGEVRDRLERH